MASIEAFLKRHLPVSVLVAVVLALTLIPILDTHQVLGDKWQGIPPTFTDETFYHARVNMVVEGMPGGNPYFFEHRNDPSLVIFAGTWINAIPQLLGIPLSAALVINMIIWSLAFALVLYWLLRELRVPSWIAVISTVLIYVQSYAHVWRPVNLQPVYPFYFLFYLALLRLIREQSRKNVVLLALATGATFYLFAYLWQAAVITLGLLFLYALVRKNWNLAKATFTASFVGGLIGLPVPLYALWLSHTSPYFWESVHRLGLVNTHLPMAEVVYSGGWIGVVLAFLALLCLRVRALREDPAFTMLGTFVAVSGLGLWVMQGSNLITGKLLETGEHVRLLILPWLIFSLVSIGMYLYRRRAELSRSMQIISIIVLALVMAVSLQITYKRFSSFLPAHIHRDLWETQALYAGPFTWLEEHEQEPVVVWSDPADFLSSNLPVFTRHFTLYTYFGMLELAPEGEIRERYLVSQYFNDPTAQELKQVSAMELYLGRRDLPHQAKTIEREIKVCRILFFWDSGKDCGTPPTSADLLGDQFFVDLEKRFATDIKPNIKAYLAKYHVSYILKDRLLDPEYDPETLEAVRVYADDRFELYRL